MGTLALLGIAAALALVFKGKKTSQPDDAPDVPTPTPDMAPVFVQVSAGDRKGQIKRLGANWPWGVSGSKVGVGSEAEPGDSVMEMLGFLLEGNNAQIVTGTVMSSGDFTVTQVDPLQWKWITTGLNVAGGTEANRGSAVIEALRALAESTDWLSLQPLQGGAAPLPEPEEPADPMEGVTVVQGQYVPPAQPEPFHGLIRTGASYVLADAPKWLAYATPIIREQIYAGGNAVDIFVALYGDVPDYAKFGKHSIEKVTDAVQKALTRFLDAKYLDPLAPDKLMAYYIAGANLPKTPPSLGIAFRQVWSPNANVSISFAAVAKAKPVAPGKQPGSGPWVWAIWNGSRGFDENAIRTGEEPNRVKAIARAKLVMKMGGAVAGTQGAQGKPPMQNGKPIDPTNDYPLPGKPGKPQAEPPWDPYNPWPDVPGEPGWNPLGQGANVGPSFEPFPGPPQTNNPNW